MKRKIAIGIGLWIAGVVLVSSCGADRWLINNKNSLISVVKAGKTTSADIQKQIDEASRKRQSAEQERQKLEDDIARLEEKKQNTLEYIEVLDGKLSELSDRIEENEKDIVEVKTEIKKLSEEKEQAIADKKKQYDTMTRRIKYMYESGSDSYLELLLDAGSLSDLFNRVEYVNKVSDYDNQMLDKYHKICDKLQKAEESLDVKLADLNALEESLKVEKESVNVLMDKKTERLKRYESIIDDKNSAIESQQKLIEQQEKELEALFEAQRKQIEKERREAAKRAADSSEAGTPSGIEPEKVVGGYRWPLAVSGRISSYFGYRNAPTAGASTYHKGIDIAVPVGTNVLASQSGTVVTAAYSSSAGNYVAVYHGDGIYTYYMHCSKLTVSAGTKVTKGQKIALSGNTGISTGPHLHFAVYANGNYVNPLSYVSH